jgi:uncharacterized protein
VTIISSGLRVDEWECWRLLRTVEVGRLCYTERALPVIRPVPFVVDGTSVLAAVGSTDALREVFLRPSIVAFEAGEWVSSPRGGWSVQIVGRAQVASPSTLPDNAKRLLPWTNGVPAQLVLVEVAVLTGQRVGT